MKSWRRSRPGKKLSIESKGMASRDGVEFCVWGRREEISWPRKPRPNAVVFVMVCEDMNGPDEDISPGS